MHVAEAGYRNVNLTVKIADLWTYEVTLWCSNEEFPDSQLKSASSKTDYIFRSLFTTQNLAEKNWDGEISPFLNISIWNSYYRSNVLVQLL